VCYFLKRWTDPDFLAGWEVKNAGAVDSEHFSSLREKIGQPCLKGYESFFRSLVGSLMVQTA
jgi:hypothetical protein